MTDEQARIWLEAHLRVSRETLARLEAYRVLLEKWSARINLVGPATLPHFWVRHVVDSAQLVPVAGPSAKTWLDVGSGAGLPGLVVAILIDDIPEAAVTLIEPSAKRCAFLREAARATGARVRVIEAKIEAVEAFPVDVVTARAFTSLRNLLASSQPWMALGARALFLKGADLGTEIAEASTFARFETKVHPSPSDPRGCVVEVSEVQRV